MRIGTSRSDRIGFIVFLSLAGLLAAFLAVTVDNGGGSEITQEINTFADVAAEEPEPVTETEAIAMPTPTPTEVPFVPAAAPEVEEEPEEVEPEEEEAADTADASTTEGNAADQGSTETPSAGNGASQQPAPAPASESNGGAVPNPQPDPNAVPNPQPDPNASPVPNPQPGPEASAVPNPQLPTAPVGNIPADAPAGGTFTHTLTAAVSQPTLHTAPGGSTFIPTFNGTQLPPVNPTVFGNPLVYRVLAGEPGDAWAKVFVPARPNGTTAWVQTAQFSWGSSNRMLQINVSSNTVTVFEGSNVLITTSAVTGKSSSPTPLANGWVEEIMAGPSSAYGPRLISLGIFSDALNSFGGGVPKVALHGTNNPGLMGQYASNGCIRIRNEVITQIAGMLPLGSKVIITG